MKILIFLHGTILMHKNALGKSREERVHQVINDDASIHDFSTYIPIGNSNQKLNKWVKQGAEIFYLSSNKSSSEIQKDIDVLNKYGFPKGDIYYRKGNMSYKEIAESIMPDILIEDDCESIGGKAEMTYTNISNQAKSKIKLIALLEFIGIDQLPDDINQLKNT